ncbi:hypothetical protein MSAN_00915800 [Mycena sanguinolenta]|uniref:Uncharacterized protein n=1 Tax=Mycena sanguinolenta TaxID=230812 RepID=A0A8H7DC22_9AGAR|nr:hypothetical protein MSAN_00915800 [Mycena sanguinolenta]
MTMHYGRSPICTPKFYASNNFETYHTHDTQERRYYWIVLDGYQIGIYSLESAARKFLPPEGKFNIVRCHTIAEASLFWRNWCKQRHILTCDPVKREQHRLELAKRQHGKSVPDSGDEPPLPGVSALPARSVDILDGPGPGPDRRTPMTPIVFPLDEKIARKLQLKADGSRLERGQSPGFKQEGPSRIKLTTPGRRRRVPEASLSPEPKLPLFVDDDENDQPSPSPNTSMQAQLSPTLVSSSTASMSVSITSASSLSASTTSAASYPAFSQSIFESVSTAHSAAARPSVAHSPTARSSAAHFSAARSSAACAPAAHSPAAHAPLARSPVDGATSDAKCKSKFKPALAASRQIDEQFGAKSASRGVGGSSPAVQSLPQTAFTSGKSPLRGPFYFNPHRKTIYCRLDTALGRMRDHHELGVMETARELEEAIKAGGLLTKGKVKAEAREPEIIEISDSDVEIP